MLGLLVTIELSNLSNLSWLTLSFYVWPNFSWEVDSWESRYLPSDRELDPALNHIFKIRDKDWTWSKALAKKTSLSFLWISVSILTAILSGHRLDLLRCLRLDVGCSQVYNKRKNRNCGMWSYFLHLFSKWMALLHHSHRRKLSNFRSWSTRGSKNQFSGHRQYFLEWIKISIHEIFVRFKCIYMYMRAYRNKCKLCFLHFGSWSQWFQETTPRPLTAEGTNNTWYSRSMECDPTPKRKNPLIHLLVWMNLKNRTPSKRTKTPRARTVWSCFHKTPEQEN